MTSLPAALAAPIARRFRVLAPNVRGAVWMLAAALSMAVMGALVKTLGARLHPFEIAFFRCAFGLLLVLPVLFREGAGGFATRRFPLHLARGALGVAAMLSGFYALTHMPIADATAIGFTKPLFMLPLAVLFLGERPGRRRVAATVVGFVGALVMVRPGTAGVDHAALVALAGAAFVACVVVTLKRLAETEPAARIIFYFGVVSTTIAALPALLVWTRPSAAEVGLLLLVALLGTLSQTCAIWSYRAGEATAVAPFGYFRLLFAGLLGFLLFAEVPDPLSLAGAAGIVGATLYLARREARRGVRPAPPAVVDEPGVNGTAAARTVRS